jgi:uncharacterized Zn-finger protein
MSIDLESARRGTPHYTGAYHKEVRVGSKGITCVGEFPPMDHPHVYYNVDETKGAVCFYCSTKFIYDPKLKETESQPDCYIRPYDKRFV